MPTTPVVRRLTLPAAGVLLTVVALAGCTDTVVSTKDTSGADRVTAPALGACRTLAPKDVDQASNATPAVPCTEPHTAETFAIGTFPQRLAGASYDDTGLGKFVYRRCGAAFLTFLGGDESETMRSLLSWAWFRPSKEAWDKKTRWYRCDVVGGPTGAASYRPLPRATLKGFMSARPDEDWTLCARGAKVAGSAKVPCSSGHDWRAVTTIRVGEAKDPYPGDRIAQIRSEQFCSDSVGAWLNYPTQNFDYGVTVFHEAEWKIGNRRSICWARTNR